MTDKPDDTPFLTADEVAGILKVTTQQVYKLGREGKLARHRFSEHMVRFHRRDVEAYIRGAREASAADYAVPQVIPF